MKPRPFGRKIFNHPERAVVLRPQPGYPRLGQAGPEVSRPRPVRLGGMAISRQWAINMLKRMGYAEAAEEASRVLPEQLELKQLEEFGDRHGISRSELVSWMGGTL